MPKIVDKKSLLSKQEEIFVAEIVKGKSQRAAYLLAYPKKKHWQDNSLDTNASILFKKTKIRNRYEELMQQMRKNEERSTMWTREESIKTLRGVIDKNQADQQRIHEACEEELLLLQKQIEEDPMNAKKYVKDMLKQRKQKRVSMIHNGGIVSAVAELNKMQGYNEENINVNGTIVFEGEEELED